MIISLRARLFMGFIIAVALLLGIFSTAVYTITRRSMIQHFDDSLLDTARMLSAVVEEEGGNTKKGLEGVDFEFDVRMTPQFNNRDGGAYYQIWNADGQTLARSPSLDGQNLKRWADSSVDPQFREVVLPNQTQGRAVLYRFLPRVEGDSMEEASASDCTLTLMLSARADGLYGHLFFLRWLLAGASAGVIVLSSCVALALSRTALGPIHSLANAITEVREDTLGLTFPADRYPAELAPICHCLNDVSDRLKKSFSREKQFNANVAHELRTPLAGIQSIIEVCLARDRQNTDYCEAMTNCLGIVTTMNKMIDTLLMLSRLEAGQIAIELESIALKPLVEDVWRFHSKRACNKQIVFQNTIADDAKCRSDKDRLGMILSNLLENAVEYTNDGGQIWMTCEPLEDEVRVSISNTGCRLTQEDVDHVFYFFWRKSLSRTDTGRHCGIGLSVAQKIAVVLASTLEVEVKEDVFAVHLTMPV